MQALAMEMCEMVSMLLDRDPSKINVDTRFSDLGLDSLMIVELVSFVEERVGRLLPEEQLPNLKSIREVVNYVAELS